MASRPIQHLRQFYTTDYTLFAEATQLPDFFQTNLVDDARVVKVFKQDPQANLRIFYYQYLKLCFEIDNVDYESYIEKIYELIRTQDFQFYFDRTDNQKQHKNKQYKSLMVDFFQLMNTGNYSVDFVLSHYPVMNEIFCNFFRTVVMLASITKQYNAYIAKTQLFDFLSSFFSVDISSYDRCLKFVESDIFVFEQDERNIYMAYIRDDEGADGKGSQTSLNRNHQQIQIQRLLIEENNKKPTISQINHKNIEDSFVFNPHSDEKAQKYIMITDIQQRKSENIIKETKAVRTIIKESYIEGEFTDYTTSNLTRLQAFGKPVHYEFDKFAQKHKQVITDKLTTNQSNSEPESHHDNDLHSFSKPFDLISTENQKQMKRVLSTDGNLNAPKVQSEHITKQILHQNHKQPLNKDYSHPNLYENRQKSNSNDLIATLTGIYSPTKDPGFGDNQSTYKYQQKKYSAKINEQIFHKPNIISPTLLGVNNLTKISEERQKSSFINPSSIVQSMKRLKLDVTKEFSNSFVMKCMKQPYKNSVHEMRERARQYRKNIYQNIQTYSNEIYQKPLTYETKGQSNYQSKQQSNYQSKGQQSYQEYNYFPKVTKNYQEQTKHQQKYQQKSKYQTQIPILNKKSQVQVNLNEYKQNSDVRINPSVGNIQMRNIQTNVNSQVPKQIYSNIQPYLNPIRQYSNPANYESVKTNAHHMNYPSPQQQKNSNLYISSPNKGVNYRK